MNGRRLIFALLLFSLLFSLVFVLANPGNVRGQMTIPTRTPVPGGDSPTDTPPDDNGGGDNGGGDNGGGDNGGGDNGDGGGQTSPTNTPAVQNTIAPLATSTRSSTAVATSEAGIIQPPGAWSTATATATSALSAPLTQKQINALAPGSTPISFPAVPSSFPTAGPCGEPPTFTTLTTANVYLGPGSDYPSSDTLAANEVRPIVGRAAYATWWLIQLDGKYTQGWISDKAGAVQGYTGNVPIIIAPAIKGAFPTPAPRWNPTAAPICTPTATPTGDAALIGGLIASADTDVAAEAQNEQSVQITDSGSVAAESGQTSENGSVSSEQRSQFAEAASPLEVPSTSAPTPNLLPVAGLVLVIAAVFVALFLRRSPSRSDPSS